MYRIEKSSAQQLTIRYLPWMQRAIGVAFVLAGCAVLFLVFPHSVRLHCDRQPNLCSMELSNPIRTQTVTWSVQDMTGARLEVLDSWNSGTTFTIWIQTRTGEVAFTPYSIGGSREKKLTTVARIKAFVANAAQGSLDEVEDERMLFYPLAAGLIGFGLLPVLFVRIVTCRLDLLKNSFVLTNSGLWGSKTVERRLSDLVEASIGAEIQGGVRMCRVVFKFNSEESVPLTYYRYYSCKKATEIVQVINTFLNRK